MYLCSSKFTKRSVKPLRESTANVKRADWVGDRSDNLCYTLIWILCRKNPMKVKFKNSLVARFHTGYPLGSWFFFWDRFFGESMQVIRTYSFRIKDSTTKNTSRMLLALSTLFGTISITHPTSDSWTEPVVDCIWPRCTALRRFQGHPRTPQPDFSGTLQRICQSTQTAQKSPNFAGALQKRAPSNGFPSNPVQSNGQRTPSDTEGRSTASTVTCSQCSKRTGPSGISGLKERVWVCSEYGVEHDRDVNAARNILIFSWVGRPDAGGLPMFGRPTAPKTCGRKEGQQSPTPLGHQRPY